MIHVLGKALNFPDPRTVQSQREPGLVAIGGDFSIERLLLAYQSGIFPWTDDPISWWSPDPRAIFEFDQFHVPRSLQKIATKCVPLQKDQPVGASTGSRFEITLDRAFREVVHHCATSRDEGNWITRKFIAAYTSLHEAGHAHSVEVWQEGRLAGGIYGVATGGLFAGESMFHHVSNASKLALYFLHEHLQRRGFSLFDIQVLTPTTRQFGAINISREEYLNRLQSALRQSVSFN